MVTACVVRVAGVPERHPVTQEAGTTEPPRPLDGVRACAGALGDQRCDQHLEGGEKSIHQPATSATHPGAGGVLAVVICVVSGWKAPGLAA